MKDAKATSEGIAGLFKKALTISISLTPAVIVTAIGLKWDFTLGQWLWYPGCATLLWIFFLMHISAFKKHKEQEKRIKELVDEKTVKLSIERVGCQRDIQTGYICRVTVRNLSKAILTNVHVRVSGEVEPGLFIDGHSPFNVPDLTPASGSRELNPNSESDWLFSEIFNQMVDQINGRVNVVSKLYGVKKADQTFIVSASASNSPPVTDRFRIIEGATAAGPDFVKV